MSFFNEKLFTCFDTATCLVTKCARNTSTVRCIYDDIYDRKLLQFTFWLRLIEILLSTTRQIATSRLSGGVEDKDADNCSTRRAIVQLLDKDYFAFECSSNEDEQNWMNELENVSFVFFKVLFFARSIVQPRGKVSFIRPQTFRDEAPADEKGNFIVCYVIGSALDVPRLH